MNQVADCEADKCSLAAEVLRSCGQLRLKAVGTSMLPTLWPGDLLTIQREDFGCVRPGDLILYARDRRFFVHRVVPEIAAKKPAALITRGDALPQADTPITAREFLGKVVAIERGGEPLTNLPRFTRWRRLLGLMLTRSDLLRRLALQLQATGSTARGVDFAGVCLISTTRTLLDAQALSTMNGWSSHSCRHEISVEVGGTAVLLRTEDSSFRDVLYDRYGDFVNPAARAHCEFDVELVTTAESGADELEVKNCRGVWSLRRGDFSAELNPSLRKGWIRQSANPYSTDTLLRVVHSLLLARQGGFLLHSASAVRNGRAFLFSGVSGAGKTTISRLAPCDVVLLSDEVSYIRRMGNEYHACGTPFTGELARVGENLSAPIAGLFFLAHGPQNCIAAMDTGSALRYLLRNILFFAEDAELVKMIFRSAFEFVERVPIRKLTFLPDARVWDLIV